MRSSELVECPSVDPHNEPAGRQYHIVQLKLFNIFVLGVGHQPTHATPSLPNARKTLFDTQQTQGTHISDDSEKKARV
jgi:hypothetical protein